MLKLASLMLALTATQLLADITVQFDEGAPKDRFTLTNAGACTLPAVTVTLDIGMAPAGLIFDVTGTGAGVQVFQPFDLVQGAALLGSAPVVRDGDSVIELPLTGLDVGESVAFTIDVDDTGTHRQTVVSGSEMSGAEVRITMAGQQMRGVFGDTATARVPTAACTS
ncbi:putative aggregation factor core [Sulfitobacter noctilucae]|uniref:hypothetical protein n=1 Tax=Sulfitobacter noctilucae TaxID=1342302 RepID=UPI0004689304|nr:hypothetical protein [Sulfitobacter noctilucae]KIN61320.1 putative aggregation factor core [Sulfitobacter noctilucae]